MTKINPLFNRILYGLFLLLTAYFVFIEKEYMTAASNLCIAFIFDPFDATQAFNERPFWQKIWLYIHVGIAAAILGYGIGIFDK
ncbi:hypothetical protein [uncultured Kordia sp.]|uniref:hypothetical protein n=1 Tax=uncultured Kordia sp. TaxID=507699 RepID=UPI002605761C|nr:hypothetical protein [uncultured Kordia sp.]